MGMKGFFFALVFLFFYFSSILQANSSQLQKNAYNKKIAQSHIWHRLLHLDKHSQPQISSPEFLLSYKNFSPENELNATINAFYTNPETKCKFPARYLWLVKELDIDETIFPSVECVSFNDYLNKTNPEELKLVFVSEQVKSPSSMMGHTFFKIEGNGEDGSLRQNAVSFFTVIDTFNIPYLIVKSTITGMKGFFILSPYQTQIKRYLKDEDRNVWEYNLNFTDFQKKIIYYHFWELKDIDITYLFAGFNCATIVDDMLGIANKDYKNTSELWITPKGVIKKANSHKLLGASVLIPSTSWELSMLSENLPEQKVSDIKYLIDKKNFEAIQNYSFSEDMTENELEHSLIKTYSEYSYESLGYLDKKNYQVIKDILSSHNQNDEKTFDLSKYKNPLNTFDNTQISISRQVGHKEGIKFDFLPASNKLYDDNREYFSESNLNIGEIALFVNNNKVSLDTLNIFAMKSLIPWNELTQNLSADFKLNYESQYDKQLEEIKAVNVNAGVGISQRIHQDVLLYGLFDVGFGYGNEKLYPYCFPQIGLMIYELFNMKSVFEYKYVLNQVDSGNGYHDFNIEQSWFYNKKYRLGLSLNRKDKHHESLNTFGVSFNYYF